MIDSEAVEESGTVQAARFERISLLAVELSQAHSSGGRDLRGGYGRGDDDLLLQGSDSEGDEGGYEDLDDPLDDRIGGVRALGAAALWRGQRQRQRQRQRAWADDDADADDDTGAGAGAGADADGEVYEEEEGEEEADDDDDEADRRARARANLRRDGGGGEGGEGGRRERRGEGVGGPGSSGATAAAMRAAAAFGGLPPMRQGRRSGARGAFASGDECDDSVGGQDKECHGDGGGEGGDGDDDDDEEYDDGASASLSVSQVSRTSSKRRRDAYREAFPVRGVTCPGCAMANRTGPVERFIQRNIGRMAEDAMWKYAALTWLREVVEPAQAEGAEIVPWAWRDIATHFTLHTTNAVVGRTGIVNGLTACRMELENTLVRVEGGERTLDKNNVDQYLKVLKMESGERELLGRCIVAGVPGAAGATGAAGASGGTTGQRPS